MRRGTDYDGFHGLKNPLHDLGFGVFFNLVIPPAGWKKDADMIELLQASTNQGFDDVREMLAVAVEKALYVTESDVDVRNAKGDGPPDDMFELGHEHLDFSNIATKTKKKKKTKKAGKKESQEDPTDTTGFELLNQLIEDLKPK